MLLKQFFKLLHLQVFNKFIFYMHFYAIYIIGFSFCQGGKIEHVYKPWLIYFPLFTDYGYILYHPLDNSFFRCLNKGMVKREHTVEEKLRWFKMVENGSSIREVTEKFGISRKTYYKWYQRFLEEGKAGLVNKPPIPRRKRRKVPVEVKELIFDLNEKTGYGPRKLARFLKEEYLIKLSPAFISKTLHEPRPVTDEAKVKDETLYTQTIKNRRDMYLDLLSFLRVPL